MDILMIVMMRQGCQDIGRYIGKLCRVICDDASRSRSKSTLGDSDGIDMVMPQGDQGARWSLITRSLTTLSKLMIPRWDCSLWRRTFNEWLPCEKLLAQRFVKMSWNALPSIFK